MTPDTDNKIIDMDAVVAELHALGHAAYVEQTGGGCATIFAGPTRTDEYGDPRHAAVAGPGWFDGPGWTLARGHVDDFYVGADDDGDTQPLCTTSTDPRAIAAVIAEQVTR